MHCNVWNVPPISSNNRIHTCQKPIDILRRLIRVSCPPGGTVLDFFMGSGSTGVAAVKEEREFIGVELDPLYFNAAKKRIEAALIEPEPITIEIPKVARRR
jgi:DNA modification methylase